MSRKGRLVSLTFRLSLVLAVGHELVVGADVEDVDQHLRHFLTHEGERPGEDVGEVSQPVGVGAAVELPDVDQVVLVLQYRGLAGHSHNINNNTT